MSSSFGLLHGLGFAAALAEVSLPKNDLVMGLLFFNAGVEIGQALLVAGATALVLTFVKGLPELSARMRQTSRVRQVCGYAVGSVATLWLFDRLVSFF